MNTQDPPDEQALPFGSRLYRELQARGRAGHLGKGLTHARLQRLKQADREGVIALLPSASYALRKLLRTGTPEEICTALEERAKRSLVVVVLGMLLACLALVYAVLSSH